MSSLTLLKERRFAPMFWTQFWGAFNDNLFKNALVLLVAFKAATESEAGILINLASGLFILPFFLFSAVAGQLSDKFDKTRIIRTVKLAELGIMVLGGIGLFWGNVPFLLVVLFLMGMHSAFFGPAKYSILPQHLGDRELTAGNGLVEMGTFLAILLGTIMAGVLLNAGIGYVVGAALFVAVLGIMSSRFIPPAAPTDPQLRISWRLVRETVELCRIAQRTRSVWLAIMGISWFWFFGATVLAQLPNFTKYFLLGNEGVVTLLLAVFSLSIGVGSGLCTYLSRGEVELGLVPLGAMGMTIFCADLFFIDYGTTAAGLRTVGEFLQSHDGLQVWRVLMDIGGLGVFGSFFIVPLYSLIQVRADERVMSRVIAANNVMNAVFMVSSALITMALYKAGLSTIGLFAVLAAANVIVATYVFLQVPEFAMRFVLWIIASTIYKLRYTGRDHIPRHGAALLVANHISFIDWLVITAACRRPVRFVMDHRIFKAPVLGLIFRLCKAIPIAPAKEDAALKEQAFRDIAAALKDGQIVCLFPEGAITWDGTMGSFKRGVEQVLADSDVPVVPVALSGLWGSFFSRKGGGALKKVPTPSHRTIDCVVGAPVTGRPSAAALEAAVRGMLV